MIILHGLKITLCGFLPVFHTKPLCRAERQVYTVIDPEADVACKDN